MSAGTPNWQRLYELGKLPKSARGNVPMLAQLDKLEKEIKKIMESLCENCQKKILVKKTSQKK